MTITSKVYGIGFLVELARLVRYYMQIKGYFDLTVVFIEVGIPTTLREIDWPKASFAKASFSQFWSTIPSQAFTENFSEIVTAVTT